MLEKEGVGCHWRHYYIGAVCYADDIVLLSPSPSTPEEGQPDSHQTRCQNLAVAQSERACRFQPGRI